MHTLIRTVDKAKQTLFVMLLLLCLAPPAQTHANENLTAWEEFKDIVANKYIYRDYKVSDWDALYSRYEAGLLNAADNEEFSKILYALILEIRDPHFWVFDSRGNQYKSYEKEWNNKINYNLECLEKIVEDYTEINPVITVGRVSNVAYILIRNFYVHNDPGEAMYFEVLSSLVDSFKDTTEGLIIDIRSNNGGNSMYGTNFAKHFVRTDALISYNDYFRIDETTNVWTKVNDYPNLFPVDLSKSAYERNVILLIGNHAGSSAETFAMEIQAAPNVKTVGDKTAGATGGPVEHILSNGIKIMVPTNASKRLDGIYVEENGIDPDQYIPFIEDDSDNILIEAFALLGVNTEPPPLVVHVTGVAVHPENAVLTLSGAPQQLTATVIPSNATNKNVTWHSSKPGVVAVDANGVIAPVSIGTAEVIVTTTDGQFEAVCSVEVVLQPVVPVPVTGVSVYPESITLATDASPRFLTATVMPENATNKNVTWHSRNPKVATVDMSGRLAPVSVGVTQITVTTLDDYYQAVCEVKIISPNFDTSKDNSGCNGVLGWMSLILCFALGSGHWTALRRKRG